MLKTIILSALMMLLLGNAYLWANQDNKTPKQSVKTSAATEQKSNTAEKTIKAPVKMPVPLNYWVHFDPKTAAQSLAAYGEFFNVNTDKKLYLTSVENNDFARVELHTLRNGKDVIADSDKAFLLPPMGGSVKLEYGGNYVLLMTPKKTITDGSETLLTLHYRVEGSDEKLTQSLPFTITSNGIGCGAIPPSE